MKRYFVAALVIGSVLLARQAVALEKADPAVVGAADKALANMPADFWQVEPAAAQQQIEAAKPFLLDVRDEKELTAGKIAGATLIPLRDLPKALAKLPENKASPILTYCKTGGRGSMATLLLRMWGYTNVRNVKGGIDGWEKANLPVVGKKA